MDLAVHLKKEERQPNKYHGKKNQAEEWWKKDFAGLDWIVDAKQCQYRGTYDADSYNFIWKTSSNQSLALRSRLEYETLSSV